jgi:hyperosmotically inducible protein
VLNRKQRRALAFLTSTAPPRGADAGERHGNPCSFDDHTITSKVEAALGDERSLGAAKLVVATIDRVVRLTGAVCSQAHIDRAAMLARAIAGVRSVENDLCLMPH